MRLAGGFGGPLALPGSAAGMGVGAGLTAHLLRGHTAACMAAVAKVERYDTALLPSGAAAQVAQAAQAALAAARSLSFTWVITSPAIPQ